MQSQSGGNKLTTVGGAAKQAAYLGMIKRPHANTKNSVHCASCRR